MLGREGHKGFGVSPSFTSAASCASFCANCLLVSNQSRMVLAAGLLVRVRVRVRVRVSKFEFDQEEALITRCRELA